MAITAKKTAAQANAGFTISANGVYLVEIGGALKTVGGFNTVFAVGDFGGGTLQLQVTPDGTDTNALDITDGSFTDDFFCNVVAKTRGLIVELTGATNPSITVWVL